MGTDHLAEDLRLWFVIMSSSTFKTKENASGGNFPAYSRPRVIGYYGVDCDRKYCGDLGRLKYIHLPTDFNVKFDLDRGRTLAQKKDDSCDEKIDNLLRWMLQNSNGGDWMSADFVCFRGLLTVLMCTPYEKNEDWIICATKWKGTIFLCAKETERKRISKEQMTDRDKQFSSWGYKFEQYMSSDKPDGIPDVTKPVNEREELCVVFRAKLNNHCLLFGAEMDGVKSTSVINNCSELAETQFIELKTSRCIETARQNQNFKRFKLVKWWSQSFLVGTSQIVCGFRDDWGMVHKLENFEVLKIPRMAGNVWDPSICMNFCDRFLSFVWSVVAEESPDTVWKFYWRPHEDVTVVKIPGPSEFSFLPTWFTQP